MLPVRGNCRGVWPGVRGPLPTGLPRTHDRCSVEKRGQGARRKVRVLRQACRRIDVVGKFQKQEISLF
jgi:hypothetical protein